MQHFFTCSHQFLEIQGYTMKMHCKLHYTRWTPRHVSGSCSLNSSAYRHMHWDFALVRWSQPNCLKTIRFWSFSNLEICSGNRPGRTANLECKVQDVMCVSLDVLLMRVFNCRERREGGVDLGSGILDWMRRLTWFLLRQESVREMLVEFFFAAVMAVEDSFFLFWKVDGGWKRKVDDDA